MNAPSFDRDGSSLDVPTWLHLLGGIIDRRPRVCIRLASLESRSLGPVLERVPLQMPVYICGLARAGTTLLHEAIASHPSVATHRMKDYPMVFTPYWWRRATAGMRPQPLRERAHRDGIMVAGDSPDALEEMLWMAFFRHARHPETNSVLNAETRRPEFESFYAAHLRKPLLAEGATRYAAKANYHVARLAYLVRLFPDAKILIAVRSPQRHIGSLVRQHEWFSQIHRRYPKTLAFMQRTGHFEFGLDRRPMQLGDPARTSQIIDDWRADREIRGWARYWDLVYSHLGSLLESDAQVKAASFVVRFESLCESPAETLRAVFRHCALTDGDGLVDRFAGKIREPAYYTSEIPPDERKAIDAATADTAQRWRVAPGRV